MSNNFKCQGVPVFPTNTIPSDEYRGLFNKVAKELGINLTWEVDNVGKGIPNVPDVELNEVQYGDEYKDVSKLKEALCKIAATIEERREATAKDIYDKFVITRSTTYSHLGEVTEAERKWLEAKAGPLALISLRILGKQHSFDYENTWAWMHDPVNHMDAASLKHYNRLRVRDLPPFTETPEYASSIPWMPKRPSFNAMWPADMTKEEIAFLAEKYTTDHPALMPYTVVERIDDQEFARIENNPLKNNKGDIVEWAVRGLNGKTYRAINIVFHPRFRPDFLEAAEILRKDANPALGSFNDYTLKMADTFENGDFVGLLKADLDQTEGNLFFTFFPHEGYWKDGVKFPVNLGIGIRRKQKKEDAQEEAQLFQELENWTANILREAGLKNYPEKTFDISNAAKTSVLVWQYKTGGLIRGFPFGEIRGHDYPKRHYEGVTIHRTVSMQDPHEAVLPMIVKGMGILLKDKTLTKDFTFDNTVDVIPKHEGAHGCGLRPEDRTLSGKTFAGSFGDYYYSILEPLADAGAFAVLSMKKLPAAKKEALALAYLADVFARPLPKEAALEDGNFFEEPHGVGGAIHRGWLYKNGVIKADPKTGEVIIDKKKIVPTMVKLYIELTRFTAKGDVEGYVKFAKDLISGIPDEIEATLIKAKNASRRPNLVDRDDNF